MSKCTSCDDLRNDAPNFVVNGVDKTTCTSLKNDTGLNPSASPLHTNCDDLDNANECLIGTMADTVEAYDVCDWKDYMKKFVPNVYNMLKAMICGECGLWTNIHNLWTKVNKHDCLIENMYDGHSFKLGEEPTDGSYMVAGKGVTFLQDSSADDFASDVLLNYVAGGLTKLTGTLRFHVDDFSEPTGVQGYNYDLDDTQGSHTDPRKSNARKGNRVWSTTSSDGGAHHMVDGGELVLEIRIKRSQYPSIKGFLNGFGQNYNMGSYTFSVIVRDAGEYASGQHGKCYQAGSAHAGEPAAEGMSYGHLVPDGYTYIQVRMNYVTQLCGSSGTLRTTLTSFLGVRFNRAKIEC